MSEEITELEKRDVLRMSNRESNRLTRECIQTALIHLMAVKDIEKITVSELVRKAGVSRTAFYNNYSTTEEVLKSLTNDLLDEINHLAWDAMAKEKRASVITAALKQIKENATLFSMMMKSDKLERSLLDIRKYMSDHYPDMNSQTRYLIYAWGGMLRSVITEWFLGGMTEEIGEITELCDRMSDGVLEIIESSDPGLFEQTMPRQI